MYRAKNAGRGGFELVTPEPLQRELSF